MAEVIEQTEFVGELDTEIKAEGVLPSDEVEAPDWVKENTSDNGKIFGRFDTMESALDYYKAQEVTHTNNMRDIKNEQKSKQEEVQSIQAELQAETLKIETMSKISQELLNNNMTFSDDMTKSLEDSGITPAEAKVMAYELRETNLASYEVMGGEDKYNEAMEFATTIYDETQQASIMNAIKNNQVSKEFRELALLGLQSKMSGSDTPSRIVGNSDNAPSIRGYGSFTELTKDRTMAKRDKTLMPQYLAKLALTDDRVLSLHG